MDFQKEATKYNETPWPSNERNNILLPAISPGTKGRTWNSVRLSDLPSLLGAMSAKLTEHASYFEILVTVVSFGGDDAVFDIQLHDVIRGFSHDGNLPGQLLNHYLLTYASIATFEKSANKTLRLAIHPDGHFWEMPLTYKNQDSGFLESLLEEDGELFFD